MKANLREIIHYIDESTLEKAKNEKVQKQESPSKMSKDVEESVDKMFSNRMSKVYSEWKSNQDTQSFNENIEKEYQKLLETLSPEQEKVLTKYCDEIFASGAETEEFFYRLGIKDGLRLKSTVKSVLEMMSLYQWFTDTYAYLSLQELKDMLKENINSIYEMIDSLSDEELFEPHMRKWADEATKTAVWEVYKFIHINTVAPFGTFRTKIRKWKKIAL